MTCTIGAHGEVVIPKSIREELNLTKGSKIDVIYANNVISFLPSVSQRTKMDEDFDRIRQSYLQDGVSLDEMLSALQEVYIENE